MTSKTTPEALERRRQDEVEAARRRELLPLELAASPTLEQIENAGHELAQLIQYFDEPGDMMASILRSEVDVTGAEIDQARARLAACHCVADRLVMALSGDEREGSDARQVALRGLVNHLLSVDRLVAAIYSAECRFVMDGAP